MANGTTIFSKIVVQTEPTYGTGNDANVALYGRRLMVSPTGVINLGQTWDIGEDRTIGVRTPIVTGRSTLTETSPEVSLDAPAVPTDELPIYLSAIGEIIPVDNEDGSWTWTWQPGMDSTAPAPVSLHAIVTDGNQGYHVKGILPTTLTLSAESGGLTSLGFSGFAKSIEKTAQVPTVGLPAITPRSIAGRTWTGATGSTSMYAGFTNFDYLYDWSLEIMAGQGPIFSQVGSTVNAGYNQFAGAFGGTLSLTVGSNPAAVSEFYDKLGQTAYFQLSFADAGSPAHSVTIGVAGIVKNVEPITGDVDGLTTYAIEVALAYDPADDACIYIQTINELSSLPIPD
jgi:hypothetical protein